MKENHRNMIYEEAIKKYGKHNELLVAAEEPCELSQAILKYMREDCTENVEHIIEEMADVLIVIEQVCKILNISQAQVDEQIDFKCNRLADRMNYSPQLNELLDRCIDTCGEIMKLKKGEQ